MACDCCTVKDNGYSIEPIDVDGEDGISIDCEDGIFYLVSWHKNKDVISTPINYCPMCGEDLYNF